MNPTTRRRLLIWFAVLVGGGVIGYFLLNQETRVEAVSPDGRYVAAVASTFPPFGGYRYDVKVRQADGLVVRHLVIRDKIYGWGRPASVVWTADSKTVTVGLQDGDTDGRPPVAHKRLSVDVP
jgi:hypothetical protein